MVDLYADPWATEEVLVITSLTDDQRATAEDIAEADAQEGARSSEDDDTGSDE